MAAALVESILIRPVYRIRIGCQLGYATEAAYPAVFVVQPPAHARQMLERESVRVVEG